MPKSNKKSDSTKKSTTQKGSVAFLYGGMLKTGCARVFWTDSKDPTDTVKDHRDNYGPDVNCRYVNCEDAEKVYTKVLKNVGDKVLWGSTVLFHATNLINLIKEVADVKQAHRCVINPKSDDKKNDKKDDKKSSKKDDNKDSKKNANNNKSDEEDSDEEESDKNEKKNSKKDSNKKSKNDESDDDGSDDEDSGKESGSDDEVSDADESGSDEESEDDKADKKSTNTAKSKKEAPDKKKDKKKK